MVRPFGFNIMATLLENLVSRRNAIGVELAALDATKAGGLPDHSGKANVGHVQYRLSLYQELAHINEQIEAASGGWEIRSEAPT